MSAKALGVAELRRFAVARSLFEPTTLGRALDVLGFVQADPIRAPARAQDLTLRHRVVGYTAGDLERLYGSLSLEEDTFINYGFVTRQVFDLMHPRGRVPAWTSTERRRVADVLRYVGERGVVHPRDVDAHFSHGRVTNYWGGSSKASTSLLEAMHYRGLLRIAGRRDGIKLYQTREPVAVAVTADERARRLDRLIDVLVRKYAPLTATGLSTVVRRLRYATPQWHGAEITRALARARQRLDRTAVDGIDWFWPADEDPRSTAEAEDVKLLTPFDPVVWDRDRFAALWGWEYRFEAYTPIAKRIRGYYALPMLWRDRVIGWANVTVTGRTLDASVGYSGARPRQLAFTRSLDEELDRLRTFLRLDASGHRPQNSLATSMMKPRSL